MERTDFRVLGVLGVILLLGAFFGFIGGQAIERLPFMRPAMEIDDRETIELLPEQKAAVLKDMRLVLEAQQSILSALSANDTQSAAKAASRMGIEANPVDRYIAARTGAQWQTMARQMREGFDDLAGAARNQVPTNDILAINARIANSCVACHQTYRLVLPRLE